MPLPQGWAAHRIAPRSCAASSRARCWWRCAAAAAHPAGGGGEHRALHRRGALHRISEWRATARRAWPSGSAERWACAPGAQAGGTIRGPAGQDDRSWAEARIKIARMTLTIKLDRNWSSFQLANSAPPLSVTGSAIAPSARIAKDALFLRSRYVSDYTLPLLCTSCRAVVTLSTSSGECKLRVHVGHGEDRVGHCCPQKLGKSH